MAITKEKKANILERLKDILKGAKSVVFVNFHGLDVGSEAELRKTLREEGVGYYVAKKTLMRRALANEKYEGEVPVLPGELALAYGEDLVVPAREVHTFSKKHKENLFILGGVFGGRYMDQVEMTDIATIPPLPVLYGQVVNLINSPIQGFVIALSQIAETKTSN